MILYFFAGLLSESCFVCINLSILMYTNRYNFGYLLYFNLNNNLMLIVGFIC